jgi:hypothetical protein
MSNGKDFMLKLAGNDSLMNWYTDADIGIPVDYLNPDYRNLKKSIEKISFDQQEINPDTGGSAIGGKVVYYTVPQVHGYCGHWMIETGLATGPTYTPLSALNMIDTIQIIIGSEIINWDKKSIMQYLMAVNKSVQRSILLDLMGNTVTTGGTYVYLPLIFPGNDGIFDEKHHQTPFCLNKLFTDLKLKITYSDAAKWQSASTTNTMDSNRLVFKTYLGGGTDGKKINTGYNYDGIKDIDRVEATYPHIWVQHDNIAYTPTSATLLNSNKIDIRHMNYDAELLFMTISDTLVTTEDSTLTPFAYTDITQMKYTIGSAEIYKHSSKPESKMLSFFNMKEVNTFNTGSADKSFYLIPFCYDYKASIMEIGSNGINIMKQTPTLYIVDGTTTAHYVHIACFYNIDLNIMKNGRPILVGVKDPTFKAPISKTK